MGQAWGEAFTSEVQRAMQAAAEALPRAGSGKFNVQLASRAPEVLQETLKNVEGFGAQIQQQLATEIGHGVNSFMDKLHISHAEAFEKFRPVLEGAIETALQFGEMLEPQMQHVPFSALILPTSNVSFPVWYNQHEHLPLAT